MKKIIPLTILSIILQASFCYAATITLASSNNDTIGNSSSQFVGQIFTGNGEALGSVTLNSYGGNQFAQLETLTSGVPNGTVLDTSNTVSTGSSCSSVVTYTFSGTVTLALGVQYAIVINSDSSFAVCAQTGNPYGGGDSAYTTVGVWLIITGEDLQGFITTAPGGGGGGGTTTPQVATSTMDQSQENLFNAFMVFFGSFFGLVWLLRRK